MWHIYNVYTRNIYDGKGSKYHIVFDHAEFGYKFQSEPTTHHDC